MEGFPLSFTEVQTIVEYIIDWLKEFLAAFDELAKGFENKFAGYTPVLTGKDEVK